MLPTVIRNLFGGPATRMYPVAVREPFPGARGQVEFNEDLCDMCGLCARRCPAVAIDLDKEKKEWILYPDRCIVCEVCAESCNRDAITIEAKWRAPFYKREPIVKQCKAVREKRAAE
jgi:ech hydrogenase subunit F